MKTTFITGLATMALLGVMIAPSMAEPPHGVDARLHDQHKRIEQGIHSGSLTRHETEALRAKESKMRYQTARDRARHGGHLTAAEHARIEREENHTSRDIYHQKHDAQHR